jgi:hypothetical protein
MLARHPYGEFGMTTDMLTAEIDAYRVRDVVARIEQINRRLARHGGVGVGEFQIELGPVETRRIRNVNQDGTVYVRTVDFQRVSLSAQRVGLPGYRFLGRIDHTGETNLLMSVPGEAIPNSYRDSKPNCDHCGHDRRRNDTFVVVEESTGQTRQIGRQCLADYLGHNPEMILAAFQALGKIRECMDEEEREAGHGGFRHGGKALDILAYTSAIVRLIGWVSKKAAEQTGQTPTAFWVEAMMLRAAQQEKRIMPDDADYVLAQNIIDYLTQTLVPCSEYEMNLIALVKREMVETKLFGYVASGLGVYNRFLEKQVAETTTKTSTSTYLGQIGERITVDVRVMRKHSFEGHYGRTTVLSFQTPDGNDLVWFQSGNQEFEVGANVKITGTVKTHKINRVSGGKETAITRVTLAKTTTGKTTTGKATKGKATEATDTAPVETATDIDLENLPF